MSDTRTTANGTKVTRTEIIGTTQVIYTAWELQGADCGPRRSSHSTLQTIDGVTHGQIGTGRLPAHIAAKAMAGFAPDAADAFHHRLLSAYFTENRTISDWSVLGEVAEEVGVDRHDFVSVAREQEHSLATVVIDEHNSAIQSGVTAVPTIVLDDVLPVQGAQDVATYETWINRLIDRRHSEA